MQKKQTRLLNALADEFNKLKKEYGKDFIDEVNKSIVHIKKGILLNYYHAFNKIEFADDKVKLVYYWLDIDSIKHIKSIASKSTKMYESHLGYIAKKDTYDIFVSNNFMAFVWLEEIKKKIGEV